MSENRRSSEASPQSSLWWRVLGLLGGMFVGAVLLFGAWAKTLDPMAFEEQIRAEGLAIVLPASAVAMIALALEVGLGGALLLGVRRLGVLIPSVGLVLFFLFLTGRSYYQYSQGIVDESAGCGCFGNLVERTPAEAFWQDLVLLVPGLVLAFFGRRPGPWPRVRMAVVSMATAGLLLLAWKSPELPLDDLATRLKVGVATADLCTGKDSDRVCLEHLLPQLAEGEHLLIIADLQQDELTGNIDALNTMVFEGRAPLVLSSGSLDEHRAFFWEWGPSFEIVEAPASMLRPLYRKMPRSFRVVDGEVVETFAGLPPLPEPQSFEDSFGSSEQSGGGGTDSGAPLGR